MKKTKTVGKGTKGKTTKKKAPKVRVFTLKNPTKADIAKLDVPRAVKEAILKSVEEMRVDAQAVRVSGDAKTCKDGCCVEILLSRADRQKITAQDMVTTLQKIVADMQSSYQPGQVLQGAPRIHTQDAQQMALPFPGQDTVQ